MKTASTKFVATAVAENLAVRDAEKFFRTLLGRADLPALDAIMARNGGARPIAIDNARIVSLTEFFRVLVALGRMQSSNDSRFLELPLVFLSKCDAVHRN